MHPAVSSAFILGYLGVTIGVGCYASRQVKTQDDYYVGGRNLGPTALTLSIFATWFGAETVLSSSGQVAADGLAGARAEPFGYALCLFIMAFAIAGAFRARGYVTLADFFRDRFGVKNEVAAVLLTILPSLIWAAAQLVALSVLLQAALGAPRELTLVVAAVCLITYTAFGGLLGDVVNDNVQSVVILAGLVIVFFAAVGDAGGFGPFLDRIRPEQLQLVAKGESWLARVDNWAMPILGSLVTQEALSRILAARSAPLARRATLSAGGLYLIVGFIPLLLALSGANLPGLAWDGSDPDAFMPALLAASVGPVVTLVFVAALLSAILSTADTNILSISSLVSVNLLNRMRPQASEAARLRLSRATTIGAGLVALIIASSGASIRDLIQLTSSLGQGGLLVAVLFGLYSKLGDGRAAMAAILANLAVNALCLALYPVAALMAGGPDSPPKGLLEALRTIAAGEAPPFATVDGAFLFALLASTVAYLAAALPRRPDGDGCLTRIRT